MAITKDDLDHALTALQKISGYDFSYDRSYGGYRLARDNGSRWVSPRLPKRDMHRWIWAYIEGFHLGRKVS